MKKLVIVGGLLCAAFMFGFLMFFIARDVHGTICIKDTYAKCVGTNIPPSSAKNSECKMYAINVCR